MSTLGMTLWSETCGPTSARRDPSLAAGVTSWTVSWRDLDRLMPHVSGVTS